jgi:chromosome segregation ATPase
MRAVRNLAFLVFGLYGFAAADEPVSKIAAGQRPITKVVTLLEEMKATCEKEGKADLEAYDKYNCWCETNIKEKTEAIANAKQRISELAAFIEASAAKQGELKTEIEALTNDIAEDNEALATATSTREKEHEDFLADEADMKETRGLLKEAVSVLSKVQLTQTKGGHPTAEVQRAAAQALIQVQNIVKRRSSKFQTEMQQDLFSVLGSLRGYAESHHVFLSKSKAASLGQLLPWEKTEEEIGMEAKPNDLKGAAAGVKSYNSRSGRILGILDEMESEFARDLGAAQKADLEAEVAFQKLRAAKLAEIAAATEQKELKEAALADSLYKSAKAQENKESVENAMEADQKFLAEVEKLQKIATEEYNDRVKVRSEEIRALGEALKILTADSARDFFGKTVSFMQLGSASSSQARAALEDKASARAMQRLAKVARRHRNWAMAALAVRVRLDAFTKVKAAMDTMLAELQKQQSEEYEKWEFCQKEIDTTEDSIKVGLNEKEDLDNKHTELTNTITTIKANIEMLKKEVADMEISLKQAGEDRHDENELYQTSIMDQRTTTNILNKVLTRLDDFYKKDAVFVQTGVRNRYDPTYNAPPPEKPKAYERSSKAGGVLQMLHTIITDAEKAEQELNFHEQEQQKDYAEFVKVTTESIEADRASIQEKTGQVASNSAMLAETEEAQTANDAELEELNEVLKAHHLDCDYLLKYFEVRQKARAEEMDAIQDAKAILSGANFGK